MARLELWGNLTAEPARVFAALTEGERLVHWCCDQAESDPVPGGRLVMRWQRQGGLGPPFEGHWLEIEPPARCVYEGGSDDYPHRNAGRVTFRIASEGAFTKLFMVHEYPGEELAIIQRLANAWPHSS